MSKYPQPLVLNELKAHQRAIEELQRDISETLLDSEHLYMPDLNLINSQPELSLELRAPLLDFLYKVCKRTSLSNEIFYCAINLFDRYCSKRVVLKNQAQLVGCSCIWIASKFEGGCNHIVNSMNKPIVNRYKGPNMRCRIPRLTEFVQLCGPSCNYDETMFIQMERHILNTLNWDLNSPSVYDWLLSVYDHQTTNDLVDSAEYFDFKKVAYIKNFLVDLSIYSVSFMSTHPSVLASLIKKLINVLVMNDEDRFGISETCLRKIFHDNSVDVMVANERDFENVYRDFSDADSLLSFGQTDNNEINKLIFAIATVSNTVYQTYTTTEYKEVNRIVTKIHKVAVSHMMALKEEERKKELQQLQQQQQQQQQQDDSYYDSPRSQRSPSVFSTASTGSSCDYEDSSSNFDTKVHTYGSPIVAAGKEAYL